MDMFSGEWSSSDLINGDPTSIMHDYQIMMNSDAFELENVFHQPRDMIFDTSINSTLLIKGNNFDPVIEATNKITPSNDRSWSSSGQIICFGSSSDDFEMNPKLSDDSKISKVGLTSIYNKEHVIAERRRREKMIQGFIALSALIPDLKKTDKASILGETAEYLKQLEERIKVLEEQTSKKTIESVCLVKKKQSQTLNDNSSTSYSYDDDQYSNKTVNLDDNLLEIEAKVLNNNILIRVHSFNKTQGLIQKILEEFGNLNLTPLNYQTMPFGSYAFFMTIVAKASDDFSMSSEGLVKHLGNALQNIIIS